MPALFCELRKNSSPTAAGAEEEVQMHHLIMFRNSCPKLTRLEKGPKRALQNARIDGENWAAPCRILGLQDCACCVSPHHICSIHVQYFFA